LTFTVFFSLLELGEIYLREQNFWHRRDMSRGKD
jgi:hypothetical protein